MDDYEQLKDLGVPNQPLKHWCGPSSLKLFKIMYQNKVEEEGDGNKKYIA